MNRSIVGCCFALALVLGFTPPAARGQERFDVGIVIPLTGDLAEYGEAIRNGFELAREEKPRSFSNVGFVYEDSRYEGKFAVSALQRLRASEQIDLYYLWGVSPTEALLPIAESNKLPVIAETTVKEATAGKKYVVRAARTGERIARALASELQKRGLKRIAMITAEITFYNDIIKHLEALAPQHGISILRIERVSPEETQLRSLMLKVLQTKADALGVFLMPSQLITYYREANKLNLAIPTFNADILDSETIVKESPDNINGAFLSHVGVTDEFRERYSAKFGNDIHVGQAAQAYDVAMIVADLFAESGPLSNDQIMERLAKITPRKGATGKFAYSDTPDGGKELRMPVSIREVRNKRIETVTANADF